MNSEHVILALLALPGVGPVTARSLAALVGGSTGPNELFDALETLSDERLRGEFSLSQVKNAWSVAQAELQACYDQGITCVATTNPEFPAEFRRIPKPPV